MPLPTLAQMDRFASRYDTSDSVGALPPLPSADMMAGLNGSDELEGVEADDLLAGLDDIDDELAWGWKSIKRFGRKAYKTARKVTRSNAFRAGLVAAAVAFPALAPAAVALEAANRIATELERGSKEAHAALEATKKAAARGDKGARRALRHIKLAQRARAAAREAHEEHKAQQAAAPHEGGGFMSRMAEATSHAKPAGTHQPPGPVRGVLTAADGTRIPGVWVKA